MQNAIQTALSEIEKQVEKYISENPIGHMPYVEVSQIKTYLSRLLPNEDVGLGDYQDYVLRDKREKDRQMNLRNNAIKAAAILVRLISELPNEPHQ